MYKHMYIIEYKLRVLHHAVSSTWSLFYKYLKFAQIKTMQKKKKEERPNDEQRLFLYFLFSEEITYKF